jgi:hypothetical protein
LLREGFAQFRTWLVAATTRRLEHLREVETALGQLEPEWIAIESSRRRRRPPWQFNEGVFPSLFEEGLGVLREGIGLQPPMSLEKWDVDAAREHVKDPVARLLLAVLWKNGDFQKVRLVLAGMREIQTADDADPPDMDSDDRQNGEDRPSETRSVFMQFGRHLAHPRTTPIFDQHTARAMMLLRRWDHWKCIETFRRLFDGDAPSIPRKAERLTTSHACQEYLQWWSGNVEVRLPEESSKDRLNGMLVSDRLLFGLGRWARPAQWSPKREEGRSRRPNPGLPDA